MSFREVKNLARTRLHDRMKVESLCYDAGPAQPATTVYLRVNSKDDALGDLPGTSLAYAEIRETVPRLIFEAENHVPVRGNVYIISPTEGYRADTIDPQDGITITANCTRLRATELANYTPPGA